MLLCIMLDTSTRSISVLPGPIRNWRFVLACAKQSAMEKETIDSLAGRLAAAVPQGLRSVQDDLEENFRGLLRSALARMDLVTREEFEVQAAVLARSRARLEELEARVAGLESGEDAGTD
jgi:BMFP domain-containing protein YqiC